jgi:adenylosuccinate lyase
MTAETVSLLALGPLDGRYAETSAPLREYFSEFALLRDRVRVEIAYLLALSELGERGSGCPLPRRLSEAERAALRALLDEFSPAEAAAIKQIEQGIRHDVKAVEYYLRQRLAAQAGLTDLLEWLHFGLTSEDVNLVAQAAQLRQARDQVLLPALDQLLSRLAELARRHRADPMLARTHGQPAVPTTLGKELAVFWGRLDQQRQILAAHRFEAKLSGAVGNFNALVAAAPGVDWIAFSRDFLHSCGLEANLLSTQLVPYDNWIRYFDALRLVNGILLDFAQDMWRYISDGYFVSRAVAGEVGSSTMPQKVNPIDFENAEGNLGLANALLTHYTQKLPVSRLQRDLSDTTVRRTFGVALGHCLVAWTSLARGLERVQADLPRMQADLEANWAVLAEGAQTILKGAGVPGAYELLKDLTRGRQLDEAGYRAWAAALPVDASVRASLLALRPANYLGLAPRLVDLALEAEESSERT